MLNVLDMDLSVYLYSSVSLVVVTNVRPYDPSEMKHYVVVNKNTNYDFLLFCEGFFLIYFLIFQNMLPFSLVTHFGPSN